MVLVGHATCPPDSRLSVIFYKKNGFAYLTKKDEDEHTRLMYFDMLELEE